SCRRIGASATSTRSTRLRSTRPRSARARPSFVPETPDEFWQRAHGALKTPPLDEWDTWPFVGRPEPRELEPPQAAERPRNGEGGIDCGRCQAGVDDALWYDDHWVLTALSEPTG